jgi:hypothetical protein
MKYEKELIALRKNGIEISENILLEKIGVLEGVRLLLSVVIQMEVKTGSRDEDFLILRGIDSEAEEVFPHPKTKELWDSKAWEAQNIGPPNYEASIKDILQKTCKIFIEKYK